MMGTPEWAVHLPAKVEAQSIDLAAGGSLPGCWVSRWQADPSHPVLFDDASGRVTAEELQARTARVAARFAAAGLVAGDRLVMSAVPSAAFVVAYVAALRLGLVVVPLNGAYLQREVAHIVTDARPAAAVVDDAARGGWIREASAGDPVITGPDVDLPDGPPVVLDGVAADAPALIAYTSGTTGAPKGAVLRHANLLASAHALRLAWRWSPDDRLVLALPLFHMHGLGVGINGTLTAGAQVVIRPGFDATDVYDAISAHGASLFFGVPTMYARLAKSARLDELSALRLAVSGSAPLPDVLWHEVAQRSGQHILERYGMTETVMLVSNPHDGERRPGAVGFALPGVELAISETSGELAVRGPNVFDGYWERAAANAEAFDGAGWFLTGDIAARDPDGYLRIVGRSKDLIISGGYNVYPREVEDVLRAHPTVNDVAVVGLPSPRWGEQVTAFVVANEPVDVAALMEFAAGQLARYKQPKEIRLVDSLPRNALGKVLKSELRQNA